MAILTNATTSYASWLLQYLPPKVMLQELSKSCKFFGMVQKRKSGGIYQRNPVKVRNITGRGVSFGNALAQAGSSTSYDFHIPVTDLFGIGEIGGQLYDVAKDNKGALLDAYVFETKSAMDGLNQDIGTYIWGTGTGTRARLASIDVANSTATLQYPEDAIKFYPGMLLSASSADGGSGRTGAATVVTVNEDTGVLSGNFASIASLGATDYLYLAGDGQQGGTAQTTIAGPPGWVTAFSGLAAADSFYGINRNSDFHLVGATFSATGLSYYEALTKGAARAARNNGSPDVCFMNPRDVANLQLELKNNVRFTDITAGGLPLRVIEMNLGDNTVKIMPEAWLSPGTAYLLQMSTWYLGYVGESALPHVLNADGLDMRANANADSYIFRLGVRLACWTDAPWKNVAITGLGAQ